VAIGRAVQCAPLCVGWTTTSCSCAIHVLLAYFSSAALTRLSSCVWVRVVCIGTSYDCTKGKYEFF